MHYIRQLYILRVIGLFPAYIPAMAREWLSKFDLPPQRTLHKPCYLFAIFTSEVKGQCSAHQLEAVLGHSCGQMTAGWNYLPNTCQTKPKNRCDIRT